MFNTFKFDVSNIDKFNDTKEMQLTNIYCILVTCEVLKLVKFISFNDLHPLNIAPI